MSEAYSPTIIEGALIFPVGIVGKIDASTTRRLSTPWTRSFGSTTEIFGLFPFDKWNKGEILTTLFDGYI